MPEAISKQKHQPAELERTSDRRLPESTEAQLLDQTAIQRARHAPNSLTPANVIALQRTVGNAAVQRILAGHATPQTPFVPLPIRLSNGHIVQPRLAVGAADDRYEREADEIARQVVSTPIAPKVQLAARAGAQFRIGPKAGRVDKEVDRSIRSGSGGSALPAGVRNVLEPKLGANLGSVKAHTDTKAADLNRQLGAKAFTHKNHIYYGAGQSPSDLQLTAHEAVHTMQQGATSARWSAHSKLLQRTYQHPENSKYYSSILPKQEIRAETGVATASATGGPGGGHTILMFEYLDSVDSFPHNLKVDLTAGGGDISSGKESGSGSSVLRGTTGGLVSSENVTSGSTSSQATTTSSIQINISEASPISISKLLKAKKRSWVVAKSQIDAALVEARNLQDDMKKNVGKYSYKLFGRSIFGKNPMNCASFGERVLKSAGIQASATSWWFGGKLPSKLASGKNVGYTPDQAFPVPSKKVVSTTPPPKTPPPKPIVSDTFDHITAPVFRQVTFADGKMIAGDTAEFDYKGTPSHVFTFRSDPLVDNDLPLTMFKITVHKDVGLARMELPASQGKVLAVWVKLTDLFNSSGVPITA